MLVFRKILRAYLMDGPYVCFYYAFENITQMVPCEFREIFKNTFFIEHLRQLLLSSTGMPFRYHQGQGKTLQDLRCLVLFNWPTDLSKQLITLTK